ncbi:carboxylase [Arthrobacter sp. MYb229]|uniref:pyruvate carboxylase subunit B n=1 Tax=unclassified Arthrobacter TaxID=235627 RepID=UPI000CFCA8F4|nr:MULTISPECIES: pyruvate carboxylase subunit B [unclassified Arthrobacter]PRA06914.1 carboxylase [Arthrobacter sp. MYb229]PRB47862.1 carboxylase [Arthrobacter sp. MYb216]
MAKIIRLEDITIRDGAQCLWATRLSTHEIVPIASTMERAGFDVVDVTGGAAIDTSIMYLQEDPFERIRILRQLMPNTRLNFNSRGQSVFRWTQYPDDVAHLTLQTFARAGIDSVMLFDPLNDMRNLVFSAQVAKELGLYIIGSVTFTISPYHTDEHFIEKTKELVEMGVDAISLKDPSGLLTAQRASSLLLRMRQVLKGQTLQLHCHASTGTAPDVHRAAMDLGDAGPDVFHGAVPPFAWGTSHPSHEFLIEELESRGFQVDIDKQALKEMESYFVGLARRRGMPTSHPILDDPEMLVHQVPGGMLSNLRQQLTDQGMVHRLPEVLEEVGRVRAELGYPLLVSPMAQYVGIQSVLNVVTGDRYSVVPDEIRSYLLGYYGQTPGPVDPNVLDKVTRGEEAITQRPGEILEPMVESFRAKNGPFADDEALALALFYSKPILSSWNKLDWDGYRSTPKNAFSLLVAGVVNNPSISQFSYSHKSKPLGINYNKTTKIQEH